VLSVLQAYYHAVLAQEQVKVQESAEKLAEQNAEYMRKREKAGMERGIDVTRSDVYVAQAKDDLNRSRQAARGAVDALMLSIGFGMGQVPELTDGVPEASQDALPDIDKSIKTALANRSELAVYDRRLSDAQRRLALKTDQLRPGLDLVVGFDSANSDAGLLSDSIFDTGSMNVGLMMSFPLDKRIAVEERDSAVRSVDILQKQRSFEEQSITDEVRAAYRSLDSARISLGIFTQNLDIAKENLRIAQRMVEEGEGDSRDVVSAQQSLTSVQSNILSAKTDFYLASMRLKYATGEDITIMGSL
jgi:outer membrane protein TolC